MTPNVITLFQNNSVPEYSLSLNMRKVTGAPEIDRLQNEEEKAQRLKMAVEKLYDDYLNDPELIVFTALDSEDFLTFYPNPIERI